MKKNILLSLLGLLAVIMMACQSQQSDIKSDDVYISDRQFLLDTLVTIKLYEDKDEEIFEDTFGYIRSLESDLSVHIEGSDLWRLKENAGGEWTNVSEYTKEILEISIEISEKSEGLFDITSGPLINLWAIDPPDGYYPTKGELKKALSLIDYKKIEIDKENSQVLLKDKGMEGNLGAIAKGYIADKVKTYLKEKEVKSGIINLGGNVLVIGNKPDGSNFKIGIQDPDSKRGEYLGVVSVSDKSVVSSGVYERFFTYEGKAYHHILNPFTGFPEDNGLKGVSIISDDSTYGDALSTAVFLMGIDKGMALVESLDGVEVIFITDDSELIVSLGVKDIFELMPESKYFISD